MKGRYLTLALELGKPFGTAVTLDQDNSLSLEWL
jgi:hypothetical protein